MPWPSHLTPEVPQINRGPPPARGCCVTASYRFLCLDYYVVLFMSWNLGGGGVLRWTKVEDPPSDVEGVFFM